MPFEFKPIERWFQSDSGLILPVPISQGGTGAVTAPAALANLGGAGVANANSWSGVNFFQGSNLRTSDLVWTDAGNTALKYEWYFNADGTFRLFDDVDSRDLLVVTPGATDAASGVRVNGSLRATRGSEVWQLSSPLGATARSPMQLLMSWYDTNPASTDQTSAFSSALADAAALISSAPNHSLVQIILDSRQKYTIGGAITSGANGQYAQVPLPFHDDTASGTIQLVGMPRGRDYSYISSGESGTVIESTLASAPAFSATNGIASTFGGPASFRTTPGVYPTEFSYLKFATKDITIRSASPVVCGIDAGWITGFSFEGLLQFDTDYLAANGIGYAGLTPCTAPQAIPIILPFNLDWYGTIGDHLVVAGWANGPMLGEYADIRRLTVFAVTGAAILLDAANQVSKIGFFTDWNNAYGIATVSGTFANNTPVSPSAGANSAPASKRTISAAAPSSGLMPSPLQIDEWNIQISAGGSFPAALARVNDILDGGSLCWITGTFNKTDDGNNIYNASGGVHPSQLSILGNGNSATGYVIGIRLKNNYTSLGPAIFNMSASATQVRNPFARDCVVFITGGTVTSVNVNTAQVATSSPATVRVPAQCLLAITYTVAPTVWWMAD